MNKKQIMFAIGLIELLAFIGSFLLSLTDEMEGFSAFIIIHICLAYVGAVVLLIIGSAKVWEWLE